LSRFLTRDHAQRARAVRRGKPEPLEHGFQGYWSRRITDEHRLVHKITEDEIRVAAWRYYYGH
jgi:toxin YoeB